MNMSELPKPKVIRAEKSGNRNLDDFKVLVVGFCFFVLLIIMQWVFVPVQESEPTTSDVTEESE